MSKFYADFHIHSKYSRATSKDINLANLSRWAGIKGISVLGTGDFTHPQWFLEMKENLTEAEAGLFMYNKQLPKIDDGDAVSLQSVKTRFILSGEISCIYTKNGKTRRVHLLILAPSLLVVEKINKQLGALGNIKSDGRPILGLDAKELTKIILNVSSQCVVIPAHAWTPWFSVFGAMSGFNSLEECFDEYTKEIFAIETGLSSDPAMNWRWSALDDIALISNSDAHSLRKIGREANCFNVDLNYKNIVDALRTKNPKQFLHTLEFFPEEGKYHYDGHLACGVVFPPDETKRHQGMCPKCGRSLTVGVLNRVLSLGDRKSGIKPKKVIPYFNLIPLDEIIAGALGVRNVSSKKVLIEYKKLIEKFGNELEVLLNVSNANLKSTTLPLIAEGILKMRLGKVNIQPGFDGQYGKVSIFDNKK